MDSRNAEDGARARNWAIAAALFLLAGAGLLFVGQGLALRLFGLVLLGHGAKALWVGVETQFEVDAAGRRRLVRLLVLDVQEFRGSERFACSLLASVGSEFRMLEALCGARHDGCAEAP